VQDVDIREQLGEELAPADRVTFVPGGDKHGHESESDKRPGKTPDRQGCLIGRLLTGAEVISERRRLAINAVVRRDSVVAIWSPVGYATPR